MFRTQNLVPEVYPDQSRDFQLFCRVFDFVFNSTKHSIDSMNRLSSTEKCDSRVLPLLRTKVGFFSDVDLNDEDLRKVLSSFPHIVKYKGSRRSIDYIVNLYSRLVSSSGTYIDVRISNPDYIIEVFSDTPIQKTELLVDLLQYVIPTGYIVDYYRTKSILIDSTLQGNSSITYQEIKQPLDDHSNVKRLYVSKVVVKKDLEHHLDSIVNMASVSDLDSIRFFNNDIEKEQIEGE